MVVNKEDRVIIQALQEECADTNTLVKAMSSVTQEIAWSHKSLHEKLYGQNGYEGDITEMKTRLKSGDEKFEVFALHAGVHEEKVKQLEKFRDRLTTWAWRVALGSVVAGVGGTGLWEILK